MMTKCSKIRLQVRVLRTNGPLVLYLIENIDCRGGSNDLTNTRDQDFEKKNQHFPAEVFIFYS